MDLWDVIATERHKLANELEGLTPEQWDTPTVCDGWSVRHILAHLVMPFEVSTPRFMLAMFANRFDLHKVTVKFASQLVDRPVDELIGSLRSNATSHWMPPKSGIHVPLGEIVVHGQDIRAALGRTAEVAPEIADELLSRIPDEDICRDYTKRMAAPAAAVGNQG